MHSIDVAIQKQYRFKIHHQSGPGFHTDFQFSMESRPSNKETKTIELTFPQNIHLAFGNHSDNLTEEYLNHLINIPFANGVQKFVDFLAEKECNISTDLRIEISDYTYHPIDSKPIGNELGIFFALKTVFLKQLNIVKEWQCIMEEL